METENGKHNAKTDVSGTFSPSTINKFIDKIIGIVKKADHDYIQDEECLEELREKIINKIIKQKEKLYGENCH